MVIPLSTNLAQMGYYFFTFIIDDQQFQLLFDTGSPSLLLSHTAGQILSLSPSFAYHYEPNCTIPQLLSLSLPDSLGAEEQCSFSVIFIDGRRLSGVLASDLLYKYLNFISLKVPLFLGIFTPRDSLFLPPEFDGILGLGPPSLDPGFPSSLGSPLLPVVRSSDYSIMTMCFGYSYGETVLSDLFPSVKGQFSFIKLNDGVGFSADYVGISFGNILIETSGFIENRKLVFDSGARNLVLSPSLFEKFKSIFYESFVEIFGLKTTRLLFDGFCVEINDRSFEDLPNFRIDFLDNISLEISSSSYIVSQIDRGIRRYCLAIKSMHSSDPKDVDILVGTLPLFDYITSFDLDQNRMGFVKKWHVNCGNTTILPCPKDCFNRGECFHGKCICHYGWFSDSCSILRASAIAQLAVFVVLTAIAIFCLLLLRSTKHRIPRSAEQLSTRRLMSPMLSI
ncbi:hypothetical protein RCL1_005772 [Eukaryota sp. TZLM3-RCL]